MDEPINGTVLIVDDVETNRAILAGMLGSAHKILSAASGGEALEIIRRTRPDLVLLDIVMPGMDGYEVCRRLKASPETHDIPVIFITAMNEDADEELGLSIGAIDYVTKPFSLPIVRARVRNHLISKTRADVIAASNVKLGSLFATIETDLKAAADLQRSLLPENGVAIHGCEFAHYYQASDLLGGDMLNYFPIGNDKAAFYIADVAGHGVPAALLSVALSNTMSAEFCARVGGVVDEDFGVPMPSAILSAMNRRFLRDGERMDYVTMIYGVIDKAKGRAHFSQAGHPNPILLRQDGSVEAIGSGGYPIGLFADVEFEDVAVDVGPGDRIILYSDGITECENSAGVAFESDRLVRVIRQDGDAFLTSLRSRMEEWLQGGDAADDMSVISIKVGSGASA